MDIYPGGAAKFFARSAADDGAGYTYSVVRGRVVSDYDGASTHEIARADLDWCCGRRSERVWVAGELLDDAGQFQPVALDEQDFRRRYAKAICKAHA